MAEPHPTVTRRRQYDSDSLLEIATTVFNQRGFDGTSMEHLASAAGITKSSIYHHFPSKDALLGRALDRAATALDDALGPVEAGLAAFAEPIDAVEAVVRRVAEALLAELPYVTLFLRVRGNTPTEQHALQVRRDFDRRVSDLMRRAAEAGQLRRDVDHDLVTKLVFGGINSLIEWYRPDGKTPAATIVDQIAALALDGLRRR